MKNEKPTLNYLLLVTFKTNLPYKTILMAIPVGLEPTFFCVTGRRRNHWTTEPNGLFIFPQITISTFSLTFTTTNNIYYSFSSFSKIIRSFSNRIKFFNYIIIYI